MKNCRDIENNLPLYLNNLLSTADNQAVEEHLKDCPRCARTLLQLQKTKKLVNNLAEVEPPAWFKQKIMAEVRREAEKKSFAQKWFYPWRIKIPIQIFTTVVIAVLAFYIYRTGNEQMREAMPLSIPAPAVENQKDRMPRQNQTEPQTGTAAAPKEKVAANKDMRDKVVRLESSSGMVTPKAEEQKNVLMREKAQQMDAAAAKSAELPAIASEKKKESYIFGTAIKATSAPRAQSTIKTNIVLNVEDIESAIEKIDKILVKYEAKNITRQLMPNKAILTAEMKNLKIKEFTTSLRTIGRISGSIVPGGNAEQYTLVVIEILND